jgi:voltage-gated potassium channel
MSAQTESNTSEKLSPLNIIILVLSAYVLIALLIDTVFHLPKEISKLLQIIDVFVCCIFLLDFFIRFFKSTNKLEFMKWGWIDLISSVPTIDFLRTGRALRLIRLLRIIKAFRSTKNLVNHLFKNKAEGTFTSVAIIALLLVIFSALAILQVENDPNSNIKTAEDALWWAYVTITTVGYGDRFPVTTEGRIIASLLMTAGVGLFGTFAGYVSSLFLQPNRKEETTSSNNR